MEYRRASLIGGALLVLFGCGDASDPNAPVVSRVPDARTLILSSGDEIVLAGIEAPRPAQGRRSAEPFYDEAQSTLEALALNRSLSLSPSNPNYRDRWDRRLALVEVKTPDEPVWVQGHLLDLGLARVAPEMAARARISEMLAREDAARDAGVGLWASPYFAVRQPEATRAAIGSFQIVEGLIVDAAEARGRVYLNFGPDYRTDFTATVAPERRETFAVEHDLLALSGARVRVRGWLTSLNGPNMELRHPAQLERLDEAP